MKQTSTIQLCDRQQTNACTLICTAIAEVIFENKKDFLTFLNNKENSTLKFQRFTQKFNVGYKTAIDKFAELQRENSNYGFGVSSAEAVRHYPNIQLKKEETIVFLASQSNTNLSTPENLGDELKKIIEEFSKDLSPTRYYHIGGISLAELYALTVAEQLQRLEMRIPGNKTKTLEKFDHLKKKFFRNEITVGEFKNQTLELVELESYRAVILTSQIKNQTFNAQNANKFVDYHDFFENLLKNETLCTIADGTHTFLVGKIEHFYLLFNSNTGQLHYDTHFGDFLEEKLQPAFTYRTETKTTTVATLVFSSFELSEREEPATITSLASGKQPTKSTKARKKSIPPTSYPGDRRSTTAPSPTHGLRTFFPRRFTAINEKEKLKEDFLNKLNSLQAKMAPHLTQPTKADDKGCTKNDWDQTFGTLYRHIIALKNALEKNLPKPNFPDIPIALCHHAEFKNFYEEAKTISEEIGGKFFIPSGDFLNERAYSSES